MNFLILVTVIFPNCSLCVQIFLSHMCHICSVFTSNALFCTYFFYRSILSLRFGLIINDGPIFRVNVLGSVLNVSYMSFYYWHISSAAARKSFWTQVVYATAVTAAVIAYSLIENPIYLQKRYGAVLTAILFFFVGSPLLGLVSSPEWQLFAQLDFVKLTQVFN